MLFRKIIKTDQHLFMVFHNKDRLYHIVEAESLLIKSIILIISQEPSIKLKSIYNFKAQYGEFTRIGS